jgi:glutaminyl-tRNA synthetase
MTGELWIEREDFMEVPKKGYFRLFPGNTVRLKYGFVVKCTAFSKGADGRVDAVHCEYMPETKSGTPGAETVKTKGVIHWLSAAHAHQCEVRLYDRLFVEPQPGAGTHTYLDDINPNAKKVIAAYLEPSLKEVKAGEKFQFERHGYFVPDAKGRGAFNRAVTLRDSWTK